MNIFSYIKSFFRVFIGLFLLSELEASDLVQRGSFQPISDQTHENQRATPQNGAEKAEAKGQDTMSGLPTGILTWGKEPIEATSDTRTTVCLNGVWAISPGAYEEHIGSGSSRWGWIRVPGSYKSNGWPRSESALVEKGTGLNWDMENISDQYWPSVWYRRQLAVPCRMQDQAIELVFERVSTDAKIYIDDQLVGEVSWPRGRVDLTAHVQPGKDHELRVWVVASAVEAEVENFMDADSVIVSKASLVSAGLIGDVLLVSRPIAETIDSVFVQTSVGEKALTLDVDLNALKESESEGLQLRVAALDQVGRVAKQFSSYSLTEADKRAGHLTVSWPWSDPELWDLDQPNLYTLRIDLENADGQVLDQYNQVFGFREFRIDGKKIYLNEIPMNFRPINAPNPRLRSVESIELTMKGFRHLGHNVMQIWPSGSDQRGAPEWTKIVAGVGDRLGMPVIADLPRLHSLIGNDGSNWENPENRAKFKELAEEQVKRLRNHPSIIMWSTTANFFAHDQDQNPRRVGTRGWANELERWRNRAKPGFEALDMVRAMDPTRPIFSHNGTYVGDIYNTNTYLCFIPLRERMDWLSHYTENGEMPFLGIEFGTPLKPTFRRGREPYGTAVRTEPLLTEFMAIYQGAEAYELETGVYRTGIASTMRDTDWGFRQPKLDLEPSFRATQKLFLRNTWLSWRMSGNSGGMIPWATNDFMWDVDPSAKLTVAPFVPGRRGEYWPEILLKEVEYGIFPPARQLSEVGELFRKVNDKVLLWIAGPKGEPSDLREQYAPGDYFEKQIMVLNDTRQDQRYQLDWRIEIDGRVHDEGHTVGTLTPTEKSIEAISSLIPNLVADGKQGTLSAQLMMAGKTVEEQFVFRVRHRAMAINNMHVSVFDPKGLTTRMLKELGVRVSTWRGEPSVGLLVIGREALEVGGDLPGSIAGVLSNGGNVMVMAQHPDTMRAKFGFRMTHHQDRIVFPVDATHPVMNGLDDGDLRYWANDATMLEPYPDYSALDDHLHDDSPHKPSSRGWAWYGWRWGNGNVVASSSIEKPHRSGFRPLLESSFDLAYTPLMEADLMGGRLVFCQLDFEDQVGADAAASRLAANLLHYLNSTPASPRVPVQVISKAPTPPIVDALGLGVPVSAKLSNQDSLLVVTADANLSRAELDAHLHSGGRALILARMPGQSLAHQKITIKLSDGSLNPPGTWWGAGLSSSDLRFRVPLDWPIFDTEATEAFGDGLFLEYKHGDGVAIMTQIDPFMLDVEQGNRVYLRFTRWRATRTLAQLVANLGGELEQDRLIVIRLDGDAFGPEGAFLPMKKNSGTSELYHSDYNSGYADGDDPFRYYRW
jgi:beta-galactosidase